MHKEDYYNEVRLEMRELHEEVGKELDARGLKIDPRVLALKNNDNTSKEEVSSV